jgi:integrase
MAPRAGFEPATNRLTADRPLISPHFAPVLRVCLRPDFIVFSVAKYILQFPGATLNCTTFVAPMLPRVDKRRRLPVVAMAKRNLTDRTLKALKAEKPGRRYEVWDSVVPGFGVRVTDKGRRTFILVARFPGSKHPTRRAIGAYGVITLEKARIKAREWLELVRRGTDPRVHEDQLRLAEQRRNQMTFAAVAEDFIKEKLATERRGREVERDIRREFIPAWGRQPIAHITPLEVRAVIKAVKDRGAPYQAHNLLGYARRLFAWAIDQHCYGLESSPCDRLKPKSIIGKKIVRSRVLDDDELRALWRAAEGIPYPYGPLFRILALTGQRKSEVANARWGELDLGRKLWTIPADRMKAEAPHVVPLSDDAVFILESLPRFNKGDHLFSTTFGVKPVNGFSKAKAVLDKAMLAELRKAAGNDATPARNKLDPFVIHDIRRTMRTGLSALPVSDLVRELVIAHTKPGLHKIYDQFAYLDEKRHALDLWAARLRNIVEVRAPNVVDLAAARA